MLSQSVQPKIFRPHTRDCYDKPRSEASSVAVAESFFNLLKRVCIRRIVYKTRDEARQDAFEYIEMFYNPICKHAHNARLSPVIFEKQQKLNLRSV